MYLVLQVYSENSHRKLAGNGGREREEGRRVVCLIWAGVCQ